MAVLGRIACRGLPAAGGQLASPRCPGRAERLPQADDRQRARPRHHTTTTDEQARAAIEYGESYLPGQPFVAWQGSAVLTPAQPAGVIWSAADE
jgi:hypothetical protein